MTTNIELNRHFHKLTHEELADSETLASMNERRFGSGISWDEALKYSRVLLFSEGGSGKTFEMKRQAKILNINGEAAFFIELDLLDKNRFEDVLIEEQLTQFKEWKLDNQKLAWFFLDAADELKLTAGKLDRALLHLAKALTEHLNRAHIIISCRTNDWQSNFDLNTVRERLPLVGEKEFQLNPDDIFIETLKPKRDRGKQLKIKNKQSDKHKGECTLILLPLSNHQISLFAKAFLPEQSGAFLAELDRQNAWIFVRRPRELKEFISYWSTQGNLGTSTQQHEESIRIKLREVPSRAVSELTAADARLCAERLALALTLTKKRSLLSPDEHGQMKIPEGVLDPATVLSEYTNNKIQALLRLPMFDPSSYGCIKFHNIYTQEYLAARYLQFLCKKGMSKKALFRLLFQEKNGYEIVIPSVRAIAAWLALWDSSVCDEVIKREPELLLSFGDPEVLDFTAKQNLLKTFVNKHGVGSWRGLKIQVEEIRRLADSKLSPLIRELWGDDSTNTEVRELLLVLIWQGRITECMDLAIAVSADSQSKDCHRIMAIKTIVDCGTSIELENLVIKITSQSDFLPSKVLTNVIADLFPAHLTTDQLIAILMQHAASKTILKEFDWPLQQIAKTIDPCSVKSIDLRKKIASLILTSCASEQEPYRNLKSTFDCLAPALSILSCAQIASGKYDNDLIEACIIASRFFNDEDGSIDARDKLKNAFRDIEKLRSDTFWLELDFMDKVLPAKDEWNRFYQAEDNGLLGWVSEVDQYWLEAALSDRNRPDRRGVALHALIKIWRQLGEVKDIGYISTLRNKIDDNETLLIILNECTTPPKRTPDDERRELDNRARQQANEDREITRIENWMSWRDEILTDPELAFSDELIMYTISNIYKFQNQSESNCLNVWNRVLVTEAFNPVITNKIEDALKKLWKETSIDLWSTRPQEKRYVTPDVWIYGFCGLSVEAAQPNWEKNISTDEARLAVAYATLEWNSFAPFLTELVIQFPNEVDSVLGNELSAELALVSGSESLPILQKLSGADTALKQLLAHRLIAALLDWPDDTETEQSQRSQYNLEQVLKILRSSQSIEDRKIIANHCRIRFVADSNAQLAVSWLKGLFFFDAACAAEVLISSLNELDDDKSQSCAETLFSAMFNHHNFISMDFVDIDQRAQVLGRLVQCAYLYIRPEKDATHESAYIPSPRDDAESARSSLLSMLLNTPGIDAQNIILDLATKPEFAHFPDRLRFLVRERAASDAEFMPLSAEDFYRLVKHYEAPPIDRDSLFAVMMDRLEDINHDIHNDDFTIRKTLKTITSENEMQRALAQMLAARSNGMFSVVAGGEVADNKLTDIRLITPNNIKAVIELKLANSSWPLNHLEVFTLCNQLKGQYLRHVDCKAGCLLLTYDGEKSYWEHPITKAHLLFQDVVTYLSEKARELEIESGSSIRLAVFGIDLTDPVLAPAHRN